jgi:hypothetical protein
MEDLESRKEEEVIAQLREGFPVEAIEVKDTGGFTSIGIQAQYIIGRLIDVFGLFAWEHEILDDKDGNPMIWIHNHTYGSGENAKVTQYAVCYGKLTIYNLDEKGNRIFLCSHKSHGGAIIINGNIGDAYKGAKTNSLCKCASYLEIAHEAYKGLLENPNDKKSKKEPPKEEKKPESKPSPAPQNPIVAKKNEVSDFMKKKGISTGKFREHVQTFYNKIEQIDLKTLKLEDWEKILISLKATYDSKDDSK